MDICIATTGVAASKAAAPPTPAAISTPCAMAGDSSVGGAGGARRRVRVADVDAVRLVVGLAVADGISLTVVLPDGIVVRALTVSRLVLVPVRAAVTVASPEAVRVCVAVNVNTDCDALRESVPVSTLVLESDLVVDKVAARVGVASCDCVCVASAVRLAVTLSVRCVGDGDAGADGEAVRMNDCVRVRPTERDCVRRALKLEERVHVGVAVAHDADRGAVPEAVGVAEGLLLRVT
jgi:hypothetical protein